MTAKPRVHEIASEMRVDSKVVLHALKEMGEYVKGPSSSVQPAVARRLRAALSGAAVSRTVRVEDVARETGTSVSAAIAALEAIAHRPISASSVVPPQLLPQLRESLGAERAARVIKLDGDRERAAVLARRLPGELPALADLVRSHLDIDQSAQRILAAAIDGGTYFYAPSSATRLIEPGGAEELTLVPEGLLAPTGVAILSGMPGDQYAAQWLIGWRTNNASVTTVRTRLRFYRSASPNPVTLLGLEPLQMENAAIGARCSADHFPLAARLLRLTQAVPTAERLSAQRPGRPTRASGDGTPADPSSEARSGSQTRLVYLRKEIRESGAERLRGAQKHERVGQWEVRGHWREQWYPSTEEHKKIWIDPHLAGHAEASTNSQPRVYVIRPRD